MEELGEADAFIGTLSLPLYVSNKLKCSLCEKFLSVGPVITDQDNALICGRCQFVNDDTNTSKSFHPQTAFELVAPFVAFMCSNERYGCKVQLKWGKVQEHENTCMYKKMKCPYSNPDFVSEKETCGWVGAGPGLNEHLENVHFESIKKLPDLDFSTCKNLLYLTKVAKQLMVVAIWKQDELFHCMVMVNGTSTDCNLYRYQLELFEPSDNEKRNSVILRRHRVEDVVGMEENLLDPSKALVIDIKTIKSMLNNAGTLNGRFGILKKSKRSLGSLEKTLHQPDSLTEQENILREFECPICKNYMIPPIYICNSGHSICKDCKCKMEKCPTCRVAYSQGRNYSLEKISASISYPCINRDGGCTVSCSSIALQEHEKECLYSGAACFFKCPSKPILNMFKHLKDHHRESNIDPGQLHIWPVGDDIDNSIFFMCFGSDIFRVCFQYDHDVEFSFSVHQFGVSNNNYIYELELICSTDSYDKLNITNECPLLHDDLFFKATKLSDEMIERFISEERLIFCKVHLKRKA